MRAVGQATVSESAVRNNITPLFSPHVWYPDSRAVVTHNIIVGENQLYQWQGATLRNLVNLGRESAVVSGMELSDNRGILIKGVAVDSVAAEAKIPADAFIVAADDAPIANIRDVGLGVDRMVRDENRTQT